MQSQQTYPYDDEFMYVDMRKKHYVLTEKALLSRGIDLRARLSRTATVSPEAVINNVLMTASDMIYQYIHEFNVNNEIQDRLILELPSARQIIYDAMLYQTVYVCTVGNLYLSKDAHDREAAMDYLAKEILNTTLPEVNRSLLYQGAWQVRFTYDK